AGSLGTDGFVGYEQAHGGNVVKARAHRRRAASAGAVLLASLAVGSFIALNAPAASAKKVTFPGVHCDSPFRTQKVGMTVDIEGPTQVDAGAKFTVTFPGGTATLPDTALDGAVNILGFRNLSTSYKSVNAFYVPGSLQTSGGATINGSPTPQTGTLSPAT